ncbi:MAG: ribonuclease R [Bacilli bacterium]|nr:ribonuclease R [Bacilli bacterium]
MKNRILEVLDKEYDAKTLIEINDLLGLRTAEELKELEISLQELIDNNVVYFTNKEKYVLLKNCPTLKMGKIAINKKGFGFVILPAEEDIYIHKDNLNGAVHDDLVLAEITKKGIKREGRILRILDRVLDNLVGEIKLVHDKKIVELDDEKNTLELILDEESASGCVEGSKVLLKVVKKLNKKKYQVKVDKIIGHKDDPGIDILSIAYKYKINPDFGEEVEQELLSIPNEVSEKDLVGRKNLSGEVIFTIDGDDTKDIDDAISLDLEKGNYRLGVHIADVSYYVNENTALGDAAFERGTSNYLADTVIPMLPHQLSNGICSLNEKVLRLTITCDMLIDKTGKVLETDIYPSYIKSRKKMTYKKVNDILMRNIIDPEYEPYADVLKEMNELAHILRKRKNNRGYINFDLDEAKVVQDENGKAIDIVVREREDGEKLIEDFMIVANEAVATYITNMDLPFIYRVHAEPKTEKIDDFVNLVKIFGYKISNSVNNMTPKTMQNILDELDDKPEFKILSSMLLRSMKKAEYSKDNIGHFGLASRCYTHFTSPIRRFPDLTVHRLLRTYLFEHDLSMETIKYYENALVNVAENSSEREVAAIEAEREVEDMKMAEYMQDHIGEIYEGTIDSVTNFGFFVELDNLVEGLVHVNTLKGDYYVYVEDLLSLIGKNTKKTYRIGDRVTVKVVNASKEAAIIDFELVEDKENGNKE